MREIRFRLRIGDKIVGWEKWCPSVGGNVDGRLFVKPNGCAGWDYIPHTDKDQFTGLCDRKGKEIYEGDILRRHLTGTLYSILEVFWNEETSGFCTRPHTPYGSNPLEKEKAGWYEIVGNVFQNKDLLKEKP